MVFGGQLKPRKTREGNQEGVPGLATQPEIWKEDNRYCKLRRRADGVMEVEL